MTYNSDTISAISTPSGTGGIAVLRVSGDRAIQIVTEVFESKKSLLSVKSHTAHFGKIVDQNKIIDEVIITVFKAPKSYTGENVVEISCHGSNFIAHQILELLLRKTRLAEPGEFTQRAFFNNKLDLTQVEAVGDLINARTKKSHQAALQQLEGSLQRKIEKLLTKLTKYRTLIELEIDFVEQGLSELNIKKTENDLWKLHSELNKLAATGNEGLILRDGLKVSLVGAPNVGKSSIFNAFLETERAIVTPHPGTTRDYLEEVISLKGYLVRIFDTAGLRKTEDAIEKIGIDRSYQIIKNSHIVLFIIDGSENKQELNLLQKLIDPAKIIKILNKTDLFSKKEEDNFKQKRYILCSAIKKDGLDRLKERLLKEIEISEKELHSGILTNSRQIAAVKRSIKSLEKAIVSIKKKLGYEFTAFDLKEASSALEEIIGKITSEDILNEIFSNFCIGK